MGFWLRSMETKEGSIVVSRKRAVQERRAAEKKERNRLNYQQNREKIIERVKERRRAIRESTTKRIKHTRRTVKEITQKKAAKQGRDEARAKDIARKAKIREQTRERVRKYRERKKIQCPNETFNTRSPGRQRSVEQIK